jgi:hypothetical protein
MAMFGLIAALGSGLKLPSTYRSPEFAEEQHVTFGGFAEAN